MIKNERQYRITRAQAGRLRRALGEAREREMGDARERWNTRRRGGREGEQG